MDLGLEPAVLTEKLSPPRALVRVGDALYSPPVAGSTVAWVAWMHLAAKRRGQGEGSRQLVALEKRAHRDGATRLRLGGPPGNYYVPGVSEEMPAWWAEALERRGYRRLSESVDLVVDVTGLGDDAAVTTRPGQADDVAWVAAQFSTGWSLECSRALAAGSLVLACDDAGTRLGFVAWGGNLAARGTFGPVGIVAAARGKGLGAALTRVALRALAVQGFATVTVPWVAPETVAFYAGLVPVRAERRHTLWEKYVTR